MRDRGIIFSAPMVRALLAGRKTQTRRILRRQPREWEAQVIDISKPLRDEEGVWGQVRTEWSSPTFDMPRGEPEREIWEPIKLPCYVGDRLWVRETWKPHSTFAGIPPREIPPSKIFYAADDAYAPSNTPWRSPIHMPRWASRLTLTVTDVRVQRLQDISEADARAEGLVWLPPVGDHGSSRGWGLAGDGFGRSRAQDAYHDLWNSIHGPAAWDANPWVAALTFSVEPRNIDSPGPVQMEDAA